MASKTFATEFFDSPEMPAKASMRLMISSEVRIVNRCLSHTFYLHFRFLVLVAFDLFLRDFERDAFWVIVRYNFCIPERIDEILDSSVEIVDVEHPDTMASNSY